MEYYSQYNTGKTDDLIELHQTHIDDLFKQGKLDEIENYLMTLSAKISEKNVDKDGSGIPSFENIEGGPFAAVIVKLEDKTNRPVIIGIGANHVVPESDPSSHGEVSAIRDATHRLGYSDLTGCIMYTSCECCPMCLSSSIASGIERITYANDRVQAEQVGFSDKEQYDYMKDMFASMARIDESSILYKKLNGFDAVILDRYDNIVSSANKDNSAIDPTDTSPSMVAIRKACKEEVNFHLPNGYKLISRKIPHPAAFIMADWARIGRVRDTKNPDDPELDAFEKDKSKILYVENEFEEISLNNKTDSNFIAKSGEEISEIFKKSVESNSINVEIKRTDDERSLNEAKKAFAIWRALVTKNSGAKY